MSGQLEFIDVDPSDPEAAELIAALDADLRERYPGMPIFGIASAGFRASGGLFLIGRVDRCNAACGALRPIDKEAVEVKRMFVRPEFRRRGLARAMLAMLEAAAGKRGYRTVRLGTGEGQPEAIALYRNAGYQPIPRYGEYAVDPESVCFEKPLT